MNFGKLLIIFFAALNADAACPKSEKEFQDQVPKFLIQIAAKESKGSISDFSSKVGKEAVAGTATMQTGSETWYFARANHKSESVSGVVKCDPKGNKLVALSLGWDAGAKGSAVIGGPIE